MTVGLQIIDVTKRWGDDIGLAAVSFDAAPGDFVVLRGRSGSGKSTLLAILAGLCRPDGGQMLLNGVPFDASTTAWHRLTFVPQTLALSNELTLLENVTDAASADGAAEAIRLMALLDLTDIAHRPPANTSMGQQQRAAVARALVTRPAILLADEPTSHQDADHADSVVSALRAAADTGTTVIIATHEGRFAMAATTIVELGIIDPGIVELGIIDPGQS
jgi:ABC-type lipoprotein export system ATPase subunit